MTHSVIEPTTPRPKAPHPTHNTNLVDILKYPKKKSWLTTYIKSLTEIIPVLKVNYSNKLTEERHQDQRGGREKRVALKDWGCLANVYFKTDDIINWRLWSCNPAKVMVSAVSNLPTKGLCSIVHSTESHRLQIWIIYWFSAPCTTHLSFFHKIHSPGHWHSRFFFFHSVTHFLALCQSACVSSGRAVSKITIRPSVCTPLLARHCCSGKLIFLLFFFLINK